MWTVDGVEARRGERAFGRPQRQASPTLIDSFQFFDLDLALLDLINLLLFSLLPSAMFPLN